MISFPVLFFRFSFFPEFTRPSSRATPLSLYILSTHDVSHSRTSSHSGRCLEFLYSLGEDAAHVRDRLVQHSNLGAPELSLFAVAVHLCLCVVQR